MIIAEKVVLNTILNIQHDHQHGCNDRGYSFQKMYDCFICIKHVGSAYSVPSCICLKLYFCVLEQNMEEEDSSDGSASSISEDLPVEDIASPDPVADAVVPPVSRVMRDDDRSQTPLQDEAAAAAADEQVTDLTGSMQELDTSQIQQQAVTNAADTSNRSDCELSKPTARDEHEELDYDEEVQPDGGPVVNTSTDSPSNACQKDADEEEREDGEEKVDN